MKKTLLSRISFLAGMVLLTLLVGACKSHTYRVVFQEVDSDRQIKPGSIAVIAGNGTGFDARLAQVIAEKLSHDTVLAVLTPDEIVGAVPGYPVSVMEQFDKREEKQQDPRILSAEEKSRLDAVHSRLKTDYVLAVWATQLEKVRFVQVPTGFVRYVYQGNIHARLVEYPSGDVLGYTRYRVDNQVDRQTANYARGKKTGEEIFLEQLIKTSADRIISRFIRGYGKNVAKK